jgi:lysophospholipase L1-like esterase
MRRQLFGFDWVIKASSAVVMAALLAALVLSDPLLSGSAYAQPNDPKTSDAKSGDPKSGDPQVKPAPATKGVTSKAIDAAKSAARSASNIFSRVPCSTPKSMKLMASLPHVARKIASGEHVSIIAFGSSSTASYGASSPAFQYPNRLADQLRRHYPNSDITVMNQGIGGEDTPEMIRRLNTSVIDQKPDLVIWQLGTNTVVKGGDIDLTTSLLEDGIKRLQKIDADVVLVDLQYVPATAAKEADSAKMVGIIGRVAQAMKVGVFPRFQVMKEWHNDRAMPFEDFVIQDGLHLNDWGYACFAQLLGDSIISSVDQVKAGIEVPSNVLTYRPM